MVHVVSVLDSVGAADRRCSVDSALSSKDVKSGEATKETDTGVLT